MEEFLIGTFKYVFYATFLWTLWEPALVNTFHFPQINWLQSLFLIWIIEIIGIYFRGDLDKTQNKK
jgi:hypothetical protein